MDLSLFAGRHFPPEVILWAVRWYCRYPLSYRHVEEMLKERGAFKLLHLIAQICTELRNFIVFNFGFPKF
jgi:transposase-like protein